MRKHHQLPIFKLILAALAVLLIIVLPAAAEDSSGAGKVVRVGYFESARFQDGMTDETPKSGYSYEYLQAVSNYTGWKYEYVYGDWSELYDMFLAGEIDVMAGISLTEERIGKILFPDNQMGTERYYLYKRDDDSTISDVPATLTGKKIGGVRDNLITICAQNWLKANGIDVEFVLFDDFEDRDAAFYASEIDCVAATDNNVAPEDGMSPLIKVGEMPYYLAVASGRVDLLNELNDALAKIDMVDIYFLERLQLEWFGNTALSSYLSGEEEEYVNSKGSLTVGYLSNLLPYSAVDSEGNATGVVVDVMDAILDKLNIEDKLSVSYTPYSTYDEMIAAVRDGTVDIAFPVGGSTWYMERDGIDMTSAVVTTGMELAYLGEYTEETTKTIAVSKTNNMQRYYIEENFPDAEIKLYDTQDDCLKAVLKGEVGSTTLNALRASAILKDSDYEDLSALLLGSGIDRGFGVAPEATTLLLILNRGLQVIGEDYGNNAAYHYTEGLYKYSFSDFVRDQLPVVATVCMILVVVILVTAIWLVRSSAEMAEKEREHQVELDRLLKRAEAANRAKTSFLFNMSHDIRTPMNAIVGFTDILEKNEEDPVRRHECIEKIKVACKSLVELVNNILEMARIENNSVTLDEKPWNVAHLNDAVFTMFELQMKEKGIKFSFTPDVKHWYCYCDKTKLAEIYMNILSNAYKYTEPGGRVDCTMKELPVGKEGYVTYQVTISDNGIGMSEDFQKHLYEQFSRERTSTESHIQGTGLGLAIVKRYVDLMGGTIQVQSKKGVGTTFIITMTHRIAREEDVPAEEMDAAEDEGVEFTGKHLLLAEDNDLNAEIAVEILTEAGFVVDRAENGKVCLEMLSAADAGTYDAILMDIQMPVMNGYETCRAIRALPDKAKASSIIIAMTANAFEEDRANALSAGMDGFVTKPIDVKSLFATLRKTIK